MFVKKRKGTHLYTNDNWRGVGGGGTYGWGSLERGILRYLFRGTRSFFERAARWKRWVLRTDNVQGQIFQHIFAANGDYCINYPSNTHIQWHAHTNPMRRQLFDGQTRGRGSKRYSTPVLSASTSGRLVERPFESKKKIQESCQPATLGTLLSVHKKILRSNGSNFSLK